MLGIHALTRPNIGPISFLCITAIATTSLSAQWTSDSFFRPEKRHTTEASRVAFNLDDAAADVDGDGDIDFIADALHLNDGFGVFTPDTSDRLPIDNSRSTHRLLVDVDSDGDPDLVVISNPSGTVWLNDGTGRFTENSGRVLPSFLGGTQAVRAADIDGDGDPDLVTISGNAVRWWRNDGTGNFADVPNAYPAPLALASSLAVGDVDNDGDQDLIAGGYRLPIRLLRNDGTGQFTLTSLGIFNGAQWVDVQLGDRNADGNLDMVIAVSQTLLANAAAVFDGDGQGGFTLDTLLPAFTTSVAPIRLDDFDADGDLDVLQFPIGLPVQLHRQDSNGGFSTEAIGTTVIGNNPMWLLFEDFDRDGDNDVITSSSLTTSHLDYRINSGNGEFVEGSERFHERNFPVSQLTNEPLAFGDLDGDGTPDEINQVGDVRMNDGAGRMSKAFTLSPVPTDAVIVDMDGDGDNDVVANVFRSTPRYWQNDGSGSLTDVSSQVFPPTFLTVGARVVAEDFTGDGRRDVLLFGESDYFFVAQPDGSFANMPAPSTPAPVNDLAVADIDRDGDLDLLTKEGSFAFTRLRIWINDGLGQFTENNAAFVSPPLNYNNDSAFLDFDSDGDPDLLLASNNGVRAWRNDGSGVFTFDSSVLTNPGSTGRITVADFDGDSDPDVVLTRILVQSNVGLEFLRNDGGTLVPAGSEPSLRTYGFSARQLFAVDLEGDADLDLVQGELIWVSREQHAHADLIVRAGGPTRFEFHVFGGGAVLPILSGSELQPPVSTALGLLRADIGRGGFFPTLVTGTDDIARLEFPMPAIAGLVGLPIFVQAITQNGAGQLGLTNTIATTIAR